MWSRNLICLVPYHHILLCIECITTQRNISRLNSSGLIHTRDAEYLLSGVRSLPSCDKNSLWMLWILLTDTPFAAGVLSTMHDLLRHIPIDRSFSKDCLTFSTIYYDCDINCTPSIELMPLCVAPARLNWLRDS